MRIPPRKAFLFLFFRVDDQKSPGWVLAPTFKGSELAPPTYSRVILRPSARTIFSPSRSRHPRSTRSELCANERRSIIGRMRCRKVAAKHQTPLTRAVPGVRGLALSTWGSPPPAIPLAPAQGENVAGKDEVVPHRRRAGRKFLANHGFFSPWPMTWLCKPGPDQAECSRGFRKGNRRPKLRENRHLHIRRASKGLAQTRFSRRP